MKTTKFNNLRKAALATVATVLLDHTRKGIAQLTFARVVGGVTEGFDAIGQTGVGQDEGDALEVAADAALGGGGASSRDDRCVIEVLTLHAEQVLETVLGLVVECVVTRDDGGVVDEANGPIEERESGEAVLDLIHN